MSADVEVWSARLDVDDAVRGRLITTLSPDERTRAAQFRGARLRDRFVAAHAALRAVLARHVGRDPRDLTFVEESRGKLRLAGDEVRFNLSRSSDLAVVAVTRDHDVGVDLERVRLDIPALSVADGFFAPEERRRLRDVAGGPRARAFFDLWTRKEAYLKAVGAGITDGLADCPRADCAVLPFQVAPGYAAAVAVRRCAASEGCAVTLRIAPLTLDGATAQQVSRAAPRPPSSSAA